jgi:hypothetical protein
VALEQAAFQQQFFAVHLEEIHRAGGGARRAEVVDFHADKMRRCAAQAIFLRRIWRWTFRGDSLDSADRYEN